MRIVSEAQFRTGQKVLAEGIGSATLVFVLVSSALLAKEMLGATLGVSILFVGVATAGWLFVIVLVFGPISGAHVNPAVTPALLVTGDVDIRTVIQYVPVQFLGGLVGVVLANLTFVSTVPARLRRLRRFDGRTTRLDVAR